MDSRTGRSLLSLALERSLVHRLGGIEFTAGKMLIYFKTCPCVESRIFLLGTRELVGFPVGEALRLGNLSAEIMAYTFCNEMSDMA